MERAPLTPEMVSRLDSLLGIEPSESGYVSVTGTPSGVIRELLQAGLIDPELKYNNAPHTQVFLDFLEKWPACYAHGSVIRPPREDYGYLIEGIGCHEERVTPAMKEEFIERFRDADEFEFKEQLFCWYD